MAEATKETPQRKPPVAGSVVVCGNCLLVLEKPAEGEIRLPKGKREEGESVLQTAVRETAEESGYSGFEFVVQLGTQSVAFKKKRKLVERSESYVLLSLDPTFLDTRGEGEAKFRPLWVSFSAAIELLSFEAEKHWARVAFEYLTQRPDALH